MGKPKVSVITAVYNGEKYLAETIESILNQTFQNFEYIIINDGSKDSSLKIITELMKKDKRIVLINNKKNIGSALSRNLGLKKAQGKYIAILDHDDISLPERLEKEYNFLEKNHDIFLVGSGAINIDKNGKKISRDKPINNLQKIINILPTKCVFHHPSVMYRNNENLFYRDKILYADDYDFYLRLLTDNKKLININELLIHYRIHEKGSSFSNAAKLSLFGEKAREFYHQRLKYGKDDYDKFDPNEILNFDVDKSIDKVALEKEIRSSFKVNDFKRVRLFYKKYFKHHGIILNKIFIYYVLSFTGEKFIELLRKVKFTFRSLKI